MTTRALDVLTMMHALDVLSKEISASTWTSVNPQQRKFFEWYYQFRQRLADVTGIKAKASNLYEELNKFLTDNGFDPMVDPFNPALGIGVVSILDKLVEWLNGPGEIVTINTVVGPKPGFEIPPFGAEIYNVAGREGLLIKLLTKSKDNLWIFTCKNPDFHGLDMAALAFDVMQRQHTTPMSEGRYVDDYPTWGAVHVPMVDFNIKPDISWMEGASAMDYVIEQAKQQFKFRMNEQGARVKVATVMVAKRGGPAEEPRTLIIDQPFYGWWTQDGFENLPMAVFHADFDSWKKPAGSLQEM